ncbi:glycosyltransferase family 4 protein [Sphingomonas crocodyli]|nr:glycosyltransferase family 1 protein [Sphingomonas crocodyli]
MPTGVDRVELAYVRGLQARLGDRLCYGATNPLGFYGRIESRIAEAFFDDLEWRWQGGKKRRWTRIEAIRQIIRMWPRPIRKPKRQHSRYLIQASPSHLDKRDRVATKVAREQAHFVCTVFDLIPIEYPEYARPDGRSIHLARVETMAALADGLVTISASVAQSIEPYVMASGRRPIMRPILLGVDLPETLIPPTLDVPAPYFVFISTIEPRKNHLLLLHAWRRMVEQHGAENVPHLVIVGRRGWENENIVDMLERCETIAGNVTELSGLSDDALFPLLAGARALLFPSFAEGFGMPVAEALSLGTPVICSDIPALREAGQDIPDYLDPLDGPGWINAVLDYAKEDSPRRAAQLERMKDWRTPTWDAHIDGVLDLIAELERTRP